MPTWCWVQVNLLNANVVLGSKPKITCEQLGKGLEQWNGMVVVFRVARVPLIVNTLLPFEVPLIVNTSVCGIVVLKSTLRGYFNRFVESCSSPSEAGFVGGYSRITVPSRGQDMGTTC